MKHLTQRGRIVKSVSSIWIAVVWLFCIIGIYAATTTLSMQVLPWSVTIGSPASLSFTSTLNASDAAQTLEQQFNTADAYFYIQDLKWADAWYSTTLQVSWPLTAGASTIPTSNISFKSINSSATLLSGTANAKVTLDASAASYQNFSSARTFLVRTNSTNNWVISKYGSQISLKVDVPAWQAVGTYTTSLVFTLIEN